MCFSHLPFRWAPVDSLAYGGYCGTRWPRSKAGRNAESAEVRVWLLVEKTFLSHLLISSAF